MICHNVFIVVLSLAIVSIILFYVHFYVTFEFNAGEQTMKPVKPKIF